MSAAPDQGDEAARLRSENARLSRIIANMVPRSFLGHVLEGGDSLKNLMVSEKDDVSVVFGDLRDFTAMTERMEARDSLILLNDLYIMIESVVSRHEGYLDNFMGDAFLAVFEPPGSAAKAMQAALRVQKMIRKYDARQGAAPGRRIRAGIGINTGRVAMGIVGGLDFFNYTIIGDCVNLAARIESLTGRFRADILASESTHALLDGAGYLHREVGSFKVKGKSTLTRLFEFFDSNDPELKRLKTRTGDRFSAALADYARGAFHAAHAGFLAGLREFPHDAAAVEYLKRCRYFLQHEPADLGQVWADDLRRAEIKDSRARRAFDRIAMRSPAAGVRHDDEAARFGAVVRDVSLGGLRFESTADLRELDLLRLRTGFGGSPMEREFGGDGFEALLQVVRRDDDGGSRQYGAAFVFVEPALDARLRRFLACPVGHDFRRCPESPLRGES